MALSQIEEVSLKIQMEPARMDNNIPVHATF